MTILKAYKKGCTFNSRDGYVPKDPDLAAQQREQSVALWCEGVGRYAEPGAMSAVLMRHWDDPKATSLSCRMIMHEGVNLFADSVGEAFEITRAD